MADNLFPEAVVSASTSKLVFAETTFGGDTAFAGGCFEGIITGPEGSRTFTPLVAGAGAVDGGTQRMTLASDDPAVVSLQLLDNAVSGNSLAVTNAGTFATQAEQSGTWNITNISGTISLPTGAATAAKQPAIGTAGTASVDVLTVQGIASMTALKVDGTGGSFPVTDSGGSLTVDNNGTFAVQAVCTNAGTFAVQAVCTNAGTFAVQSTSVIPGTGATNLGKAEDSPHADGDTGVMPLGVRNDDSTTGLVGSNADYGPFAVNARGNQLVAGAVSHDAALASVHYPVLAGGYASAAAPTDVSTDGDAARFWTLKNGSQVVNLAAGGTLITATGTSINANITNASLTVASHAVTNAGTFAVQVDGSALTSLQLIDDVIFSDDAAFTPGASKVAAIGCQADETATDSVDEGDVGCPRMTLDRKQIVTNQPHSAGGLSLFRSLDLDETEEDVKTSAGCLYKLRITNFATSMRYVKLYNATAANVTVGATTPIDTIPIPPAAASGCIVLTENFGGVGLTFDTALSMAATTALADADTGAPAANDIVISAYFK